MKNELLEKYESEFKSWTRLLLTLSIGTLTFIIAPNPPNADLILLLCLFALFLSSVFGLASQNQIMKDFYARIQEASKHPNREEAHAKEQQESKINHDKTPRHQTVCYKLQFWFFVLSYVGLLYLFVSTSISNWR